jgi:serine/threonine protein kinase/tetratricopeptide (TPR) repeat protein
MESIVVPEDPDNSLGDDATFAKKASARRHAAEVSLGDERTLGDSPSGQDTVIDDIEVVDLEARYRVEGTLGQGGMGAVLLATDTRLERKVAIKRILGDAAMNRTAVQRFLTEAKAIAALNHPNVVQIHDYGRAKDGPFLIMEYVDGGSLLDRCRESALPLGEAIDLACHLCDGLAKAHGLGIIHRDIKPANVLLTHDGIPKLTDFGLAKAQASDHGQTMTGAVLGTPDFMPPEQRRDSSLVDHRSDLWSLAATLYQAVTGRSPRIIRFDMLPAGLSKVLGKALEDRKEERYQSAVEFQNALWQAGNASPSGKFAKSPATSMEVEHEGRCAACGAIHTDLSRKFCRKCGSQLQVPCLQCDEQTPVWETICGECGANQPGLLADLRAKLDSQRSTVERLAAAGFLGEANAAARELADEATHPVLAEIAAWAVGFARDTVEEIERQRVAAARQLAEARKHAADRDDAAAIAAIESIPEPMRDDAAGSLLTSCKSRLEEAATLIEIAGARVAADDLDGLLPSVSRILELRGDLDEFVALHRRLVSRRDERLRFARNALARNDLEEACAALSGARIEDFGECDSPLVQQVLGCEAFVKPLSEAIVAERQGDCAAAAIALNAIPKPLRGTIVPGRAESIASFFERVRGVVYSEMQRQERIARHAACREQVTRLRAVKLARRQEDLEACKRSGLAAEEARCVFETTTGPIVVVIQRSWSASWALWFVTAVKAGAFDAAALRLWQAVRPVCDKASCHELSDQAFLDLDTSLRVVPHLGPPAANQSEWTARRTVLERRCKHGLLVAIECSSDSDATPAVLLNASGSGEEAVIGWIERDASVDALVAAQEARKLRGGGLGTIIGVVKTVRLAAPPDCRDLTPRLQHGLDLAAQSRWEESVAALQTAVTQDPQDVKAWVSIGQGYKRLGRYDEGIAAMERAFAANPQISLFLYNKACYHVLAGNVGPAVESLAKAVAMRPEWQEAAKKDSDFTMVRQDKAFLAVVGNREPSRRLQAELKQGLTLAKRGRCQEAVAALYDFTTRHPHVLEAWLEIGRCLTKLGRHGDAAEAMQQGLRVVRQNPQLTYNLACYRSLAGDNTAALQALIAAISLHPQYGSRAEVDRDFDRVRSDRRFGVIVAGAYKT